MRRVLLYETNSGSPATLVMRVDQLPGAGISVFQRGVASVKEASLSRRANEKMKRLASERLSGAFILTRVCTADYKSRGIYKTNVLKPPGPINQG